MSYFVFDEFFLGVQRHIKECLTKTGFHPCVQGKYREYHKKNRKCKQGMQANPSFDGLKSPIKEELLIPPPRGLSPLQKGLFEDLLQALICELLLFKNLAILFSQIQQSKERGDIFLTSLFLFVWFLSFDAQEKVQYRFVNQGIEIRQLVCFFYRQYT